MSVILPQTIDTSAMTKKQIKKLKKNIFFEQKLPEIRAKQRKNLKIKKLKKKEDIQRKISQGENVNFQSYPEYAKGRGKNFKEKFKQEMKQFQPIIIDCAFENLHRMKDLKSLGNQFSQILGANRKLADVGRLSEEDRKRGIQNKAFNVYLTGVVPNNGKTQFPENIP